MAEFTGLAVNEVPLFTPEKHYAWHRSNNKIGKILYPTLALLCCFILYTLIHSRNQSRASNCFLNETTCLPDPLFCLALTNSQAQSILLGIDVLEQSAFVRCPASASVS